MQGRDARADTAELLGLYPPAPALLPLAPALLNAPDHHGRMTKQGIEFKSWKERYFLLCGTQLFYFALPPGPTVVPKGVIHVLGSRAELDSSSGRANTIALWARVGFTGKRQYQGRTYLLQAPDGAAMSAWLVALQRAARASLVPLTPVNSPPSPRLSSATAQPPLSPRPASTNSPTKSSANAASASSSAPQLSPRPASAQGGPSRSSAQGSPRRSFLGSSRTFAAADADHCALVLIAADPLSADAFECGGWFLLRQLLAHPPSSVLLSTLIIYAPSLPTYHPFYAHASRFLPLSALTSPSSSSLRITAALIIADHDDALPIRPSAVLSALGAKGLTRVPCVVSSVSQLPSTLTPGAAEAVPITCGPFAGPLLSRTASSSTLPSSDAAPVDEGALARHLWVLLPSPQPLHIAGPIPLSPYAALTAAREVLGTRVQLRSAPSDLIGAWPSSPSTLTLDSCGAPWAVMCRARAKRVAIIASAAHAQLACLIAHALSIRGSSARLLAPAAAHGRFRDVLPADAELTVCESVEELRPLMLNGTALLVALQDWTLGGPSSRPFAAALAAAGLGCVLLGAAPALVATASVLLAPYKEVESTLELATVPFRVVHLSPLLQALGRSAASTVKEESRLYSPWGSGRVSYFDARDAAAAVGALCTGLMAGSAPPQRRFTLTGPEAIEHTAMAAALTALLGRAILYQPQDESAYQAALKAGRMSEQELPPLLALARAYGADAGAVVSADAVQLHGWTPRSFQTWLKDNTLLFS